MILYYGEKTTARRAAKAAVFHYGAAAQVHEWHDMGIESDKLTEKERTKLEDEVALQLERVMKFLDV